MVISQKHVFWQALLATILVFGLGLLLGFALENYRTSKMAKLYTQSEIQLLDVRVLSNLYEIENINCEKAIDENIAFADKIYEEAKMLDEYEDASRLSEDIILQHKKYDLLRTLFWINSIKIKKECNASYHNVVYFYNYRTPRLEQRAKQHVFSKLLEKLKEKKGKEIMLIPIAADTELASISILLETHNLTELPVILIDEKIKVLDVESVEELERLLN